LLTRAELLQRIDDLLISNPSYNDLRDNNLTASSVLVIIHYNCNTPHIILTKRSNNIRVHPGEVCFPGGRYDRLVDRNPLDTAIRETHEELGLAINTEEILGCLQPVRTITSKFLIYPFVTIKQSIISSVYQSPEVDRVIDAPLYELLDSMDTDQRYSKITSNNRMYKFKFKHDIIWGATSRILKQLHDRLYKTSCLTSCEKRNDSWPDVEA
jgi:8-oxo-dGTP pyrophosphatase MutT (NUDIX family)